MPEPHECITFLMTLSVVGGFVWGVMSRRMRGSRWYLYASFFAGMFVMIDVSIMYQESAVRCMTKAAIGWSWVPVLIVTFLLTRKLVPSAKKKSNQANSSRSH